MVWVDGALNSGWLIVLFLLGVLKSPNSKILPSTSSHGMMVRRNSSTAIVSGALTVHIPEMRLDNSCRLTRPLI